jgi:hypothetical protein
MTDVLFTVIAIAFAYWLGRYRRERKARDVFFGRITVIDGRTCPVCGIRVTGGPLDIQAHGLQHAITV